MNGWPSRFSACFDHRMAAALDRKAERAVDLGPHIIVVVRELCQSGRDIEQRKGCAAARRSSLAASAIAREPLEDLQFEPERAVAGIGDLGFDLAEFGRW